MIAEMLRAQACQRKLLYIGADDDDVMTSDISDERSPSDALSVGAR